MPIVGKKQPDFKDIGFSTEAYIFFQCFIFKMVHLVLGSLLFNCNSFSYKLQLPACLCLILLL